MYETPSPFTSADVPFHWNPVALKSTLICAPALVASALVWSAWIFSPMSVTIESLRTLSNISQFATPIFLTSKKAGRNPVVTLVPVALPLPV